MGGAAARCWRAPRPTLSPWDAASGGGLHPVALGCGRRQRRGCPHPAASALPIVSSVWWRPARARARSPPPWPSGAPHGGSHPRMAGMTLPQATGEWRSFPACSLEAWTPDLGCRDATAAGCCGEKKRAARVLLRWGRDNDQGGRVLRWEQR
jgi:hypothetical protein